ncbi:transposase [Aggregatibacter actinomycetemcomitans]|uniref:transposase n=1 Tax=Aggregatibacter actinomycetemcomitans TaxID=714 RepID=UPI0011D37F9A|nr:transposase [Aggregatibacter actinomycetemcomitans]MBN6067955.1 transposase [Aggregatibacter actinomycetemcomitans]MBN6085892.1 transposase [Aggregatibacter actinomycetemcomitans]QEH44809.1 transposase [Aggregatibacter actinomycetemcomitans]QEH46469.1 transposase [Aggregatibacter actinomycetemcomitans]QEH48879.1 transposase [Aggregatibacter actinomycetemcomitans]
MTKLFSPTFKQQCVDLMLKQHHTIAQVSKMMSVSTSALQRRRVQYLNEQQGITPNNHYCRAPRNPGYRLKWCCCGGH